MQQLLLAVCKLWIGGKRMVGFASQRPSILAEVVETVQCAPSAASGTPPVPLPLRKCSRCEVEPHASHQLSNKLIALAWDVGLLLHR